MFVELYIENHFFCRCPVDTTGLTTAFEKQQYYERIARGMLRGEIRTLIELYDDPQLYFYVAGVQSKMNDPAFESEKLKKAA